MKWLLILMLFNSFFFFGCNSKVQTNNSVHKKINSLNWFNTILKKYVSGRAFKYSCLIRNEHDLEMFEQNVMTLKKQKSPIGGNEELAYWINIYNIFTISLILDNYPVNSIMEIQEDGKNVFNISFINIGGKEYTLDGIENYLIKKFNEPRIHFALNCAAYSCPCLRNEVYEGNKLNDQFDNQINTFLSKKHLNSFFITKSQLPKLDIKISEIFKWYEKDFGGREEVINFLIKYLPANYKPFFISKNYSIEYIPYDWKLNEYDDK